MGSEQRTATATRETLICVLLLVSTASVPAAAAEPRFAPSASLRLRFELEDFATNDQTRARMRLRARLGGSYALGDGFDVAGRLTTGSENPTSSQITLGESFAKQPMRLDEAYARYRYGDSISLWAGKAPLPFETRRLLWDRDVRGEGLGQRLLAKLASTTRLVLAAGQYSLLATDDIRDSAYLLGQQIGVELAFDPVELELYAGYHDFVGVNQIQLPFARDTNTRSPAGLLRDDYDLLSALLGAKYLGAIFAARAHVEIACNTAAASAGNALTAGATFSITSEALGEGELGLGYDYRYVERNAILDALAESSWHRQRTDSAGHRVALSYAIKAWILSSSLKSMNTIDGPGDRQREWLTDVRWQL